PIVPPAPGLFSTTNGWLSLIDSACATARATTSVALPAVKGTITCTGLVGYSCASTVEAASAATAAITKRRMRSSHLFSLSGDVPADAGHVEAAQDAFARGSELLAHGS